MALVDGKALLQARNSKNWTQGELSEETKPRINISTISRIERGKSTRIHDRTLRELGRALGVSPSSLCATREAERDLVKLRVESAARNALTLVALRYGVSRENIVEIAPLLFFIAAEQSLKERQSRIEEVCDHAESLLDLQRRIGHFPPRSPIDGEAVSSEEQSIQALDLFGERVVQEMWPFMSSDYDEAEQNPFVAFLRNALDMASNAEAATVSWTPGLWPRYEICTEEAAAIVGGDVDATHAILSGAALLHEMPKASSADRADWARAEFSRKYGDIVFQLNDFIGAPPNDHKSQETAAPGSGAKS